MGLFSVEMARKEKQLTEEKFGDHAHQRKSLRIRKHKLNYFTNARN